MGMVVHSRDVTWHERWEPPISLTPTVETGVSNPLSVAETLDYVYIQPSTCCYCHARRRSCARSSYRRTGACISSAARHRTSTSAAIEPPSTNPRSRCSRAGERGGRAHAWTRPSESWIAEISNGPPNCPFQRFPNTVNSGEGEGVGAR